MPGVEVSLFERSTRLGGVIETRYADGRILELGADNFATAIPDALEMSREMGLDGMLVSPRLEHAFAQVVCGGRVLPIPMGFSLLQPTRVWPIVTTPILSWRGKLRVLWEWFVKARREGGDESLRDFTIRRLGREAYDRLVEPIVGGIFTADGNRLSMAAAMPQFVAMEREHGGLIRGYRAQVRRQRGGEALRHSRQASGARYQQFVAPREGMQRWLDAIEQKLEGVAIQRGVAVDMVERDGAKWLVRGDRVEDGKFDGVLIATPTHVASQLLRLVDGVEAARLASIEYASSAVVMLLLKKSAIPADNLCFGVIVPRVEGRSVLAISMTSEKYAGRVGGDEILLRVFLGGAHAEGILEHTDEALYAMTWRDVVELLGVEGEVMEWRVQRWREAMPQYHVGHLEKVAALRAWSEGMSGFALAGSGYEGVGIPQCVRSARRGVEKLCADLGVFGEGA